MLLNRPPGTQWSFSIYSFYREELKKHKLEQMKKKQAAAEEYEYEYEEDYHDDNQEYQDDDYDYSRDGEEDDEDEEKKPSIRLKVPFSPQKGVLDSLVPKAQIAR